MSITRIGEALSLLRTYGWQQGAMGNGSGPHCLLGAMSAVSYPESDPESASETAVPGDFDSQTWNRDLDAITGVIQETSTDHQRIVPFNDDHNTTFGDIERVMEAALQKRLAETA